MLSPLSISLARSARRAKRADQRGRSGSRATAAAEAGSTNRYPCGDDLLATSPTRGRRGMVAGRSANQPAAPTGESRLPRRYKVEIT